MYTEPVWFESTNNHQYVNYSLNPTMHKQNMQMILTFYQTDSSISIVYYTHGSDIAWKIGEIKKDHFFQFSKVISKINSALYLFAR